ncbi:MAG TPA: condensation domain-containing protein, partial [Pyrinomonadaceae bacterium]
LYIGGAGVGRGYLQRADLTAERFVPDPYAGRAGARMYASGDLVRHLPSGVLEYLGRNDEQVKVRGYRIELAEIEAVLREQSQVQEAVVVVSEPMPEDKRLLAYWVNRTTTAAATPSELRQYLLARLPQYMVPSAYIELPQMPLTANGKIDRNALPLPSANRSELKEEYVAPRDGIEEVLALIWAEVLGIDRVGVNDNFFALGGDSIRSVRVVALARKRGLDLQIQDIFQNQTISNLARETKITEARTNAFSHTEPFSLTPAQDLLKLPDDLEDAYPLAALQKGMLYHMQSTPGQPIYHNVNSFRLRLRFDIEALQEAVDQTVKRHANLRTSFDLVNYSEPLQLVHKNATLSIQVIDLRQLSHVEQMTEANAFLEAENTRVFDLSRPPLIRLHFHRFTDETCMFTLTEPHAISDGWSTMSMISEIFNRYFAILHHEPLPSQEPPSLAYRDFIFQERQALNSEEHQNYWSEKLRDPNLIKMPQWPSTASQVTKKDKLTNIVPHELVDELKQFARNNLIPLKSVLLAVHLKVLSVISGDTDIITGLGENGRIEDVDGDQVRGLFLNTVPFRFKLLPGSWSDLARQVFDNERELLPYRRYPMAAMQKQFGRQPLFETMFSFLNFHVAGNLVRPGELELMPGMRDLSHTNFALEVNCELHPTSPPQLILSIGFNTALLNEEQIKNFHGYYDKVMREMVSNPTGHHESSDYLATNEKQQLLIEWNNTEAKNSTNTTLSELFAEQAARTPTAVAVRYGDAELTYEELVVRVNQLARHLRGLGVGPEVRVGILLERSLEMVVGILGTLTAGGAYVPVEVSYPPERVRYMLQDAGVAVVLTTGQHAAQVSGGGDYRVVRLDEQWEQVAQESAAQFDSEVVAENLAYVIYTSGSTGKPKGVMITHGNLVNYLSWAREKYGLAGSKGAPLHSSVAFDLSITSLLGPLVSGCAVHLLGEEQGMEGLTTALQRGPEYGLVKLTPSHLKLVEQSLTGAAVAASTQVLVLGGEGLQAESLNFWRQHGPGLRIINEYGPTETTV